MEGFQMPVIPFADIFGNKGTAPPAQIVCDVPKLKVGVMFSFTVTVNIVTGAHNPGAGVKV
jgi:hypothetical protein